MFGQFRERGVHVIIGVLPWDYGTQDDVLTGEPSVMPKTVAAMMQALGADGFNADTMTGAAKDYFIEAHELGIVPAIEPDNYYSGAAGLKWNVFSWVYDMQRYEDNRPFRAAPAVSRFKVIEPRHIPHI